MKHGLSTAYTLSLVIALLMATALLAGLLFPTVVNSTEEVSKL